MLQEIHLYFCLSVVHSASVQHCFAVQLTNRKDCPSGRVEVLFWPLSAPQEGTLFSFFRLFSHFTQCFTRGVKTLLSELQPKNSSALKSFTLNFTWDLFSNICCLRVLAPHIRASPPDLGMYSAQISIHSKTLKPPPPHR